MREITFHSSMELLNQGFDWAKKQAFLYVHDEGKAGKWYEAALPGRNAFCMRDVSHQAEGAAAMGLCEHTKNMLLLFAKSISKEKDYCGWWEITGDGLPCPDDYDNDNDFWYNLPGSFEVIRACYMEYLWTGDEAYITDPDFLNFYRLSCNEFVAQWDKDGDGVMEHYPEQGRRGIATYNEVDIMLKVGGDMLASQYAGYGCAAALFLAAGDTEEAGRCLDKQKYLKDQYLSVWHRADGKGFYGALMNDGTFMQEYDLEGNFLPIRFGILDGEKEMKEAIAQLAAHEPANVEGRSYYPQIFYRCGEYEKGKKYLLSLCDPALYRKEYPEVSYALVGTVTNWLMGIGADADGVVSTCSALEDQEWAALEKVSVRNTVLDVKHWGRTETVLTNLGGENIFWKAAFIGRHDYAVCGGKKCRCVWEQNAAGETISCVKVEVKAGDEVMIKIYKETEREDEG